MSYSKIVKLASGNIQLQDASDNPIKTLQPSANLELLPQGKGVRVMQWQGENTDLLISEVDFTRLDPAADVAFSGTAQDLLTLLSDSFFFELEGSSFVDYPVDSYQGFTNGHSTTSPNFILAVDKIEGIVVEIKKACNIVSSRIRITSAVAGSAVVGLYKYNLTDDIWELIAQTDPSSEFVLGSASTQEVNFISSTSFEAGVYASVIHADAAATMYSFIRPAAAMYFGYNATISTTSDKSYVFQNETYTGTLPLTATFTISYRSGGLLPFIIHKIAS